jgi:hypothetical protein
MKRFWKTLQRVPPHTPEGGIMVALMVASAASVSDEWHRNGAAEGVFTALLMAALLTGLNQFRKAMDRL